MSERAGDSTAATASGSQPPRRAKDIFGDCALVEIIHLHDCFRGALKNLEVDVSELCREITASVEEGGAPSASHQAPASSDGISINSSNNANSRVIGLERRVAGRFTVIWSVFRAHSSAEDEFIWPALKAKQVALPDVHPPHPASPGRVSRASDASIDVGLQANQQQQQPDVGAPNDYLPRDGAAAAQGGDGDDQHPQRRERAQSIVHQIEQEEYEEDHENEEKMFNSINTLLSKLRDELAGRRSNSSTSSEPAAEANPEDGEKEASLPQLAQQLQESTKNLMRHLITHLDKEETHCMPLVAECLTKAEINDLVGKIMGKRSSELMSQILTMAVQNLNEEDRDDMVRYMKQAMVGTFFERWLKMGGWLGSSPTTEDSPKEDDDGGGKMPLEEQGVRENGVVPSAASNEVNDAESDAKLEATLDDPQIETGDQSPSLPVLPYAAAASATPTGRSANTYAEEDVKEKYTSAAELEKLIRAIGTNPHLDSKQKGLTIQGLRDSVWKSNCRLSKRKREEEQVLLVQGQPLAQVARSESPAAANSYAAVDTSVPGMSGMPPSQSHHICYPISAGGGTRFKRDTPPSSYFKKMEDGSVKLVWSSDPLSIKFRPQNDGTVPLFSASELAPTYHDGGINQVLGCPHYARSCKLRHPTSGRLYTCRLCCEQTREMADKDKDSPLDRYEVEECLCMKCGALQPAGERCVNPDCLAAGKPFARYTCNICNFYDDSPNRSIYHCPFCNVCRSGKGLGIDYRHCMRCNACVSLNGDHNCIPQRLQGNCPICSESMFQSTEPLRGLRCGHVMHLSCYSRYMRGHTYTCPLCKKSAEDMTEYFGLLDSAVRMQPMPPSYAATTSNIYCQDCCKMGNVSYHFVGLKCQHCGSYNTRELQRVDANIMASLYQGGY